MLGIYLDFYFLLQSFYTFLRALVCTLYNTNNKCFAPIYICRHEPSLITFFFVMPFE